jgi:hypothetical protein
MTFRRVVSAFWKSALITFVGLVSIQINIHFDFLIINIVSYLAIPIVLIAYSLGLNGSNLSWQVTILMNFIMWMVMLIYLENFRSPRVKGSSLSILQR